ncbi:hypothetical protein [Galbitalea soli]|uniref:PBP domain-containing protein n=1 Tax=Galbitalea soli TaxID=1268042 RepID=A0A7C9TQA2_9MICO|nr:hypothetical protein [Galbitalea soli]NEM90801.1 hypothetical protein [Galbitalea soli]NYJ31519.1 hypothetical protein [Galbitalea soli]
MGRVTRRARHAATVPPVQRVVRAACIAVAALSAIALSLTIPPGDSASAQAASAVTVKWAGDTGSAAGYQPARDSSSPFYQEFKNISVTVDQTSGLADQAIQVDVSGFAGTQGATDYSGAYWSSAKNFFQAMQCWGTDPLANDFYTSCEWGGRYANNNGLGNTVYPDNVPRVSTNSIQFTAASPRDVPFVTAGGTSISGRQSAPTVAGGQPTYPLADYFSPATTNEVQSARINVDGTGTFQFETQSSDEAPQLGCGTEGHLRCWLVLVPRGTVYGGHDDYCSQIYDAVTNDHPVYGQVGEIQAGSPVNPSCDYWKNRISVPLDFTPTGNTCSVGNTERRLVGSQLMVGALASWQPQLCTDLKTTFSFSSNPDAIAREQLLDAETGLSFASYPITPKEVADSDAALAELKTAQLSYAPIAVTSAVVAYQAEGPDGRITQLKLSPRLLAKLLTQSYVFEIPYTTSDEGKTIAHLGAVNRTYQYFNQDPDFQALNPNWAQFASNPSIVIPGPSGADAIRQIWKWIDADSDASSWLAGTPDPWGMTVNPYYLPKGDPKAQVPTFTSTGAYATDASGKVITKPVGLINLDGSGLRLATAPQDNFPKADETVAPVVLGAERYRYGTLQSQPYVNDFITAARTAFRADPGAKTLWDPTVLSQTGDKGDWVSAGAQIPGQRFMIALTDAPSAEKYALSTASLRLDNASNDFAGPTDAALTAALTSGLTSTGVAGVDQVDPGKVTVGGYPLTTVVYAIVNLGGTDAAARTDFSRFIASSSTTGQVAGVEQGQLPPGYLPLTSAMVDQAKASAAAIAAYVTPTSAPSPTPTTASNGPAQDPYSPPVGAGGAGAGATGPAGATGGTVTAVANPSADRTPTTPVPPIIRGSLALSLGGGISGALFAPLLFRGRRFP